MLNLNGMLSIVMPAYNEEKLIYHSIMETLRIVEKFVPELEIIVVNDGSKDNTKAEIERAIKQDSRVRMVSSEKNRGKGCLLYTSPSPRDAHESRMPSSA